MAVFYISDTHFNEERAFTLSLRSQYFQNVAEATEEMVKRWNKVVKEKDTVYHLGDFGDFEVAKRLNGKIILLYGNYERSGQEPTEEQRKSFHKIITNEIGIYVNGEVYVHEPTNYALFKEWYLKLTNVDLTGTFYLFGHIHEKQKVKRNGLNVGVDVHNFTPVGENIIDFYQEAIQYFYDENCFDNF